MKKASRILLTIGAIFHIVDGVTFILVSIYFFSASILFFATGQNLFGFNYSSGSAEEAANITFIIAAWVYIFVGILFIAFGVISFVTSKLTFQARENGDKHKFITVIVLSAILDVAAAVVGAIFGLIVLNKEKQETK